MKLALPGDVRDVSVDFGARANRGDEQPELIVGPLDGRARARQIVVVCAAIGVDSLPDRNGELWSSAITRFPERSSSLSESR